MVAHLNTLMTMKAAGGDKAQQQRRSGDLAAQFADEGGAARGHGATCP
jgi:hypothetical protein